MDAVEVTFAVVVGVVLLFAVRALALWYWKVNAGIAMLTRIEGHLAAMSGRDNATVAEGKVKVEQEEIRLAARSGY